MNARFLVVGVAALVGLSIATPASAEETAKPKKKNDGYGYIFTDDILAAEGIGANTAQIRVIKVGRRDQLLRPRVHFIPEMLKSVENM